MTGVGRYRGHHVLDAREVAIATHLNTLVGRHPEVAIGSYPERQAKRWSVKITVEALSQTDAQAALDDLRTTFAADLVGTEPISYSGPGGTDAG